MYLLDYLPNDLINRIGSPQITYPVIGSPASQLIGYDPRRVFLGFGVVANGLSVSIDPLLSATKPGWPVPQNSQYPFILAYWQVGPIVCLPWFGLAGVGTTVMVVSHSLLPTADIGNEAPMPTVARAPVPTIRPVTGPLAQLWSKLTGRIPE